MNNAIHGSVNDSRSIGLRVREECLSLLLGGTISEALRLSYCGHPAIALKSLLPKWLTDAVRTDMCADNNWKEEHWVTNQGQDVHLVSQNHFLQAPPSARFSASDCLRRPCATSYSVRGFLSALTDLDAAIGLSRVCNETIAFKSADIARYRQGHYLRRHADLFEDRRFAIVFFFGDCWQQGCGGELLVEASSGVAMAFPPLEGCVVVMPIRPDFYHQVAVNISDTWIRQSIACHFHLKQNR